MLYYKKIRLIEGIDFTKSKNSNKWVVFHYCYFNHGFKFQWSISNGCHDLLIMSPNINNFAIITIKGAYYRCIVYGVRSSYA